MSCNRCCFDKYCCEKPFELIFWEPRACPGDCSQWTRGKKKKIFLILFLKFFLKDNFEPFSCYNKPNILCFAAGYIFYCCMLPVAFYYLLLLVIAAFSLIWICPPVAILLQAAPFVNRDYYNVFEWFELNYKRADPTEAGHHEPITNRYETI